MLADCEAQLSERTLEALIALVRQYTGIAMNERKSVLLQGRLGPRLRALAIPSYEQYMALVRAGGAEVQVFIDMVTTNDTLFFRTPAVWDYIERDFLPHWDAARCLRIWSAAAATGEEAYSLAMLCEQFLQRHPGFRYQIVGTDISATALEAARAGQYEGRSVERFQASHPQLLARYCRRSGTRITVNPELKQHVQFGSHNLLRKLDAAPFDLVMLRNVLIYFDETNQRQVLEQVQRQMAPGARLVLGEQESITRLGTALQYQQAHIYHRDAA
ncbi:protein-glutamate O-methyltransferase CheR [Massilia sp. CF038]|uniref:CheR family methyltransferase n=1 Tax=Massilia sp. CF038 TaxID=1881045 RepID=UPI000914FFAC|nr:protein-glutamate O-methyltransferase CheR [Massilia sp. CF038]SHH39330.1 chemotaxis protein methyltransferase CheR [Massilia sp. CF038]